LAFLAAGEASAAVPPARLIASTVKLATLATAGGFAAVPAGVAGPAYAQNVLKGGSLIALGRTAAVVAVVGLGLAGAGTGALLRRKHPQAAAPEAPAALDPVVFSPPGQPTGPSRDAEWIQGRWIVLDAEQRGQPLDIVIGDRLVIEGARFIWTANWGEPERIFSRGTTRGRVALELTADPRRLELTEPGRTIRGLYRLSEREQHFLLCLGDPDDPGWPREFASDPDSRQLLLVFRRDGPPPGRRTGPADPGRDVSTIEKERP
jgi:uncharacterized protein (TIGR03067 family)